MKCSYITFATLVVLQYRLITGLSEYMPIHFPEEAMNGNCSKIVSHTVSQMVPYLETYRQKTWGFFYKTRTRWNYRLEYHKTWRKEFECCVGYSLIETPSIKLCRPICQPDCGNGVCLKPNICLCHYGYSKYGQEEKRKISDPVCLPICSHTCVNGKCTAPETCTCNKGYSLATDGYTCEPLCTLPCANGSYCSKPDHCACHNGYRRNTSLVASGKKLSHICSPICESECVNGECVAPDTCACKNGYEPDPDDLFVCRPKCERGCLHGTCTGPDVCTCEKGYSLMKKNPGVCEPICSDACVMGTCVAPESCSCHEGYGLPEGSKYVCEPVCERTCLNGRCTAPGVCTCNDGFRWRGEESARHICEPHCETSCDPYGVCTAPNVCTCFEGYRLIDKVHVREMSTPYFADNSICEPVCDTECVNGFCSAPNTCSCDSGYYPSHNATNVCEPVCLEKCVNGFCSAPQICTCAKGYRPSSNSKNDSLNVCEPFCEIECVNGHCIAPNECACNDGYRPTDGDRPSLCEPICDPSCKNGVCILPDVCNCNPGYRLSTTVSANACEPVCHPSCKTNGVCEGPDLCVCKDGYRMVYYDEWNVPFRCEPICDVECGNGTCTAPNVCVCFNGYRNAITGGCEPICTGCNNGTCVAPEICECNEGYVLEGPRVDLEIRASRSVHGDGGSGNGSRCSPRCSRGCENGECVAPNECRCRAGFAKNDGTCVQVCWNGCGAHGECDEVRKTCECNYGWAGTHCERPTLCVSIVNDDDGNRTETLSIEEQNATIDYVLLNNPMCPNCVNKINNETLCFKINGTEDEQIGCLMSGVECLLSSSQYPKEIKLSAIAGVSGILLLIAVAAYVLLRKYRNKQMDLGDERVICRHNISTEGLIEQIAADTL